MDTNTKKLYKKYDRVMSHVHNRLRSTLKSASNVTRHEIPSTVRVGAKSLVSDINSCVFNDLPVVLNDYTPESSCEKVSKRSVVVKPRKTIRSMDFVISPDRSPLMPEYSSRKSSNIKVRGSAPSVLFQGRGKLSDTHLRQCSSSRSHSKLNELKEEIKAYHNMEKYMKLRSHLYKSCGVVLDEVGQVAANKAVQVDDTQSDEVRTSIR